MFRKSQGYEVRKMLQRGSPVSLRLGWVQVWCGALQPYFWVGYSFWIWRLRDFVSYIAVFLLSCQKRSRRVLLFYALTCLWWRLFYALFECCVFLVKIVLRRKVSGRSKYLVSFYRRVVVKKKEKLCYVRSFFEDTVSLFFYWFRKCSAVCCLDQLWFSAYVGKLLSLQSYFLKAWGSAKTVLLVTGVKLRLFSWRSFRHIFKYIQTKLLSWATAMCFVRTLVTFWGFRRLRLRGFFLRCAGRAHSKRSRLAQMKQILVDKSTRGRVDWLFDSSQCSLSTRFGAVGVTLCLVYF